MRLVSHLKDETVPRQRSPTPPKETRQNVRNQETEPKGGKLVIERGREVSYI